MAPSSSYTVLRQNKELAPPRGMCVVILEIMNPPRPLRYKSFQEISSPLKTEI